LEFQYKERPNAVQNWVKIYFLSQLKQYRLDIATLQETMRQGKDIMDMQSHILFVSGQEKEPENLGWDLW